MKKAIRVTSLVFVVLLCICGFAVINSSFNNYQIYLNAFQGLEFSLFGFLRKEGLVVIPGVVFIIASILFIINQKIGWILTSSMMVVSCLFIGIFFAALIKFDSISSIATVATVLAVIALAVFSVWAKSTRERFNIERNGMIGSLATVVVFGITFFIMTKLKQ